MRRERVRLVDVAAQAKVSRATASAVLGGRAREMHISNATEMRVRRVAHDLGYRANLNARRLRSRHTNTVGVLAAHLGDIWYGQLINELDAELARAGYGMLLTTAQSRPGRHVACMEILDANSVDGTVFVGAALPVGEVLEYPAASASVWIPGLWDVPAPLGVGIDQDHAARVLVDHLVELGHTRFGYVGFSSTQADSPRRLEFCRRALATHDLDLPEECVSLAECLAGLKSQAAGHEAALELLRDAPQITAVIAFDDNTAFGVMQAASQMGRRVGKDLSVAGCDDNPYATLVSPPLTTVRYPAQAVARQAVDALIKMIRADRDKPAEHIFLPGLFVARQSTGPAPSPNTGE